MTFTLSIPGDPRAIELLRALKGAPLSCLHALQIAHPTPLNRDQLCIMTGWKKDLVTKAMQLLCDLYGLASRIARYNGWCLTSKGAQLELPGIARIEPRALGEGDLIALPHHDVHDDDAVPPSAPGSCIMVGEGEKIALAEIRTQVIEILGGAGIEGPNLDKLSEHVAPDIASAWAHWIENCDRQRWTTPQGFAVRSLKKNATALPPPIKNKETERPKRKPLFRGKFATVTGKLAYLSNKEEETE